MTAPDSNNQQPAVSDNQRMVFGFIHSAFEWAVTQKKAALQAEA